MMIYAHLLGKFGCITQAPKHKIGCIFMLMGQLHNVPFPRCNTVIWLYTDTSVVLDFSPLQNDIKTNITYHSCTVEVNVVLYLIQSQISGWIKA